MAKEFAKDFYNSKTWRDTQRLYKQSKYGICERCKQPKGTIVHHKQYLTPYNINDLDVSLSFDNLELLCIDCHNKEHFEKYSAVREDVCFDALGRLIKKEESADAPL